MKNLYPSFDVEVAAEEGKLEVIELLAEVEGGNYEEAALSLACTMSQEDVDREDLQHLVHRRKKKKVSRQGEG